MDETKQREIARKGGESVPAEKRSFSQNRALAAEAGRKGGTSRGTRANDEKSGNTATSPSQTERVSNYRAKNSSAHAAEEHDEEFDEIEEDADDEEENSSQYRN